MAYLGQSNSLYDPTRVTPTTVQTFNGDGITTQFTLQYSILQSIDIEVLVENVFQQPDYAYTAIGNVVTFTSPPPVGTNNIYVRFGKVTGLTGTVPDGSVTSSKLANNIRLLATDMYTGTGSQTAFNLSDTPADANSLIVSVNGVSQAAPSNYTVSGSTITFTSAPASGANVVIRNVGFRTTQTLFAFPSGTQMVQPVITGGNISNATLANTSFTGSFAQSNAINGYDAFSATRAGRTFSWGLDVSGNYGIWDTTTSVNNRLLIDSSGNVGIGTSSPGYRLEVSYGSTSDALVITGSVDNTTPYLSFKSSNGGTSYIRARIRGAAPDSTNGGLVFETGTSGSTSERMRLDASGNLGLGLSPSAWHSNFKALQTGNNYAAFVGDGSNGYAEVLNNCYASGASTYNYYATLAATRYSQQLGSHKWYIAGAGSGGSAISWTQAMTLDASGNLLVGTTTAGGAPLALRNPATSAGKQWYVGPYSTNSFLVYNQSSVGVYVTDGGTSWTASSDERLKTDLKPIENATQKVSSLRAVTGRFKTDDEGVSRSFLIAQDVQAVLPEAVDATDPDKLGVQYTDTIPLLVAAIKELSAKVDSLQSELTQLKSSK